MEIVYRQDGEGRGAAVEEGERSKTGTERTIRKRERKRENVGKER